MVEKEPITLKFQKYMVTNVYEDIISEVGGEQIMMFALSNGFRPSKLKTIFNDPEYKLNGNHNGSILWQPN